MSQKIRVLLADDSPTMRHALKSLLGADPRLEVAGAAADGEEVLRLARNLKPDVISMDVQMPKLDGLEATRRIMAESPCRIVVVSSHTQDHEMNLSFNAVQAGALEIFGKPLAGSPADLEVWGKKLADLLARVAGIPLTFTSKAAPTGTSRLDLPSHSTEIFGFAASTGGPPVLAEILGKLPKDFPIPVLIAQHITEGFTGGFRWWLSQAAKLSVEIPRDGDRLQTGVVYLAPDGCNLEVEKGVLRTPPNGMGVCPSGDRLLSSMARAYGSKAGGAVLTGMGEDGARGLLEIQKAGGLTLAQDEASCVVYGMPRFALELGAARQKLSTGEIAQVLQRLCQPKVPTGQSFREGKP